MNRNIPRRDMMDKLILHGESMREGTPDPTNLKKNKRLLRELSRQRLKGAKNLADPNSPLLNAWQT